MDTHREQLEQRVLSSFDWKEWAPVAGLYFVPRNIMQGESGLRSRTQVLFNGWYHALVSVALPVADAYFAFERFL